MALRLTLALLMLAVTIVVAGRRVGWLTRLIRSGQPAPGRTDRIGDRLRAGRRMQAEEGERTECEPRRRSSR